MSKLTVEDIREILMQEIGWCKESAETPPSLFQAGFIGGLEQALGLILSAELNKEIEDE